MKLSAPKHVTFFIALIAGGLAVVMHYRIISLSALRPYEFVLLAGSWALLILASLLKGL